MPFIRVRLERAEARNVRLCFLYRQYPNQLSYFDLYIRLFHFHSGGYGPEIELRFMSSTMYV